MRNAIALCLVAGMALGVAERPAEASVDPFPCVARPMPRHVLIARLAAQYGETRQDFYPIDNQFVLELFASPATSGYTIVKTMAGGASCVVAVGYGYKPKQGKQL